MRKERRSWRAEEKTRPLRRHLMERVPISKICEDEQLAPSLYHRWREQLFQNAAAASESKRAPEKAKEQQRIEKLEQRIRQKDEVLAGLMMEHVALKKSLGNSKRFWVEPDVRDKVVAFVQTSSRKTRLAVEQFRRGWS